MKTKILIPIAVLFLGNIAASCNSCNKKAASDSTTYQEATTTEAMPDTTVVADGNSADAATPAASSASANESTGKARSNPKADAKSNDKSKSGYSAPDGTDAENHDGDQYTKNDDKPKPTGPPIK